MGSGYDWRHTLSCGALRVSPDESGYAFMKKVVIIGGGLAGLSAGYHLSDCEPVVFEREREIGGLCRSFRQEGFTVDGAGRLIPLKTPYVKHLHARTLPRALE